MEEQTFVVVGVGQSPVNTPGTFTLVTDNWDDYLFKTSYVLYFATAQEVIEIGGVKVATKGMAAEDPHTDLPNKFASLGDSYFSLGQDREYYALLEKLPRQIGLAALNALRDIAQDPSIFEQVKAEPAFETSLLRNVPEMTVTTQFRRIISGQAQLTQYDFQYSMPLYGTLAPTLRLEFNVHPDQLPPTNVHVLIGSNGVGKSKMLRDFVLSASSPTHPGSFIDLSSPATSGSDASIFANIVRVAYSAFDQDGTASSDADQEPQIYTVGLTNEEGQDLVDQFVHSLAICRRGRRRGRWLSAIGTLADADPLLADMNLATLVDGDSTDPNSDARKMFNPMSSGHKIVILTMTRLIELVEERSLVLLDEPETHLHPPLLSALTRAISNLLLDRNGVAIVGTHSPVILQEVPRSCVWVLRRSGNDVRASRLPEDSETFGESVSRLTSEVFGLDVNRTGYTKVLNDLLTAHGGSGVQVMERLASQIGSEGQFVLSSMA